MKHGQFTQRAFRAEPRTPKEREVFSVMTVSADGADLYLATTAGVLHLQDAAACAVLEELAGSARRRLLDLEIDEMRGANGHAAEAPVGPAAARGAALRDPVRVLPSPPARGLVAGVADAARGAGDEHHGSETAGGPRPAA